MKSQGDLAPALGDYDGILPEHFHPAIKLRVGWVEYRQARFGRPLSLGVRTIGMEPLQTCTLNRTDKLGLPISILCGSHGPTERIVGRNNGQPVEAGNSIDTNERLADFQDHFAGRSFYPVISGFVGTD